MSVMRSRQWWLAVCALCGIVLAAWANSFQCGFVLDNKALLLMDVKVHQVTRENIALILNHTWFWPAMEGGLYRPVTTLSWLFNYAILGNTDHPAGYHWINLLLHAGNVLLVFALARRLVKDPGPSFLIAALWAVHPVLTESVTNIVGRADLLAGMTTLGGLLIYLRSTETSGWRQWAWLVALTAVTTVGVFSKESAVAVAAIIALYELTWWDRKRLYGLFQACLAMSPAFLAMWWARARVLSASAPAEFPFVDNPIVGADFWTGRLTALKVLALYLERLVWPAHLSADYSYPQIPLADGRLTDWIAWTVVVAAAIAVAVLFRRNKTAFFGAGFALVAILPASNLVIPIGTIMAERLLYLPAIGFSICLTLALYAFCRRIGAGAQAPLVLGLLITAAFGVRTWIRNKDWRDDFTFWAATVRTSPRSFKAHTSFGIQMIEGEHLDYDRALREGESAVALLDPLPDDLNNPELYVRTGEWYFTVADNSFRTDPDGKEIVQPESIPKYERARTLLLRAAAMLKARHQAEEDRALGFSSVPGNPALISRQSDFLDYLILSMTDDRLAKTEESLQYAEQAQTTSPEHPEGYLQLHYVLQSSGRRADALATLMQGVLVTSDAGLEQKLVQDYSGNPAESACAVSFAQAEPSLNYSCEIVRKEMCSVTDGVIRTALQIHGRVAAIRMRDKLAQFGCEAQVQF
jgi:tetratricopeptide (TPR) repeat protein